MKRNLLLLFSLLLAGLTSLSAQRTVEGTVTDESGEGLIGAYLSLRYAINDRLSLTAGANNLLDVYPDLNRVENQSSGRFLYSRRSQQFGANGRYVFLRANFSLL